MRRATAFRVRAGAVRAISTHALREEGDDSVYAQYLWAIGISTHALREEGDQLTPVSHWTSVISTHALREEGDVI